MRGRGEIIDPVAMASPLHVLIAVPPFSISTPAVYRAWDELGGPRSRRAIPAPLPVAHLLDELANDLEPAAERVEPALGAVPGRAGGGRRGAGAAGRERVGVLDPVRRPRRGASRRDAGCSDALGITAHLGSTLRS